MVGTDPTWPQHVRQGDHLLWSGDAGLARACYERALDEIAGAGLRRPSTVLWRAVTEWRIGVADYVTGDPVSADEAFTTADALLADLTLTAPRPAVRDDVHAIQVDALRLRGILGASPDWPEIVQAIRTCPHGCASITGDCGRTVAHC